MTKEQTKEQAIQSIAQLLRDNSFKLEFKVVKKPKGIKIVFEVTQEQMNELVENAMGGRRQTVRTAVASYPS